jgi:hypothetical protein
VPANAPLAKPAIRSNLRPTAVLTFDRGEAPLQVVEDETRRRSLARDGDNGSPARASNREHLAVAKRGMDLGHAGPVTAECGGAVEQLSCSARKRIRVPFGDAHRAGESAVSRHDGRRLDLRRDLDEIRERSPRIHDSDGIKVQTSRP